MAAAEWSKYGNAGGWQLPPKKKKDDYDVWSLPGVVAGGGGGTSVGIGGGPSIYQKPERSMSKDQRLRRFTDWKKRYGSGNIAIKQDQLDTSSYPDMQFGENLNAPWRQDSRILKEQKALRGIEEGGGSLMPFARPSEEQASMQRRLLRENMVRPGSNLYSQWRENQNIGTSPSLEFITGGKK